jgi:uncharacterized damage-inducible protein DinB
MPGLVPPVADEREALLGYLAQQRYVLRVATFGLSDEQLKSTPSVSAFSIGGIVKHVAYAERGWIDIVLQRDRSSDYGANLALTSDETMAEVLAAYDEVAAETERAVRALADLDVAVPVPADVPWFPRDVAAWSARWVLLHLIEETARHAGHADIIRESLDGATAYPLMAAVENWPVTEWLAPWEPPVAAS